MDEHEGSESNMDEYGGSESESEQTVNTDIIDEYYIHNSFNTCDRVVELKNMNKTVRGTYENVFDTSFVKEELQINSLESELEDNGNIAEVEILQEDGKLTYLRCKNVTQNLAKKKTPTHTENEVDEVKNDSEAATKNLLNNTEISNAETNPIETDKKRKYERLQNICIFCDKLVQNFSRHMIRNHNEECEVRKLLLYPKKSCERQRMLTALRKKGNYVLNAKKCVRPMKMKMHSLYEDYLPCNNCLGFYARTRLRKHRATCTLNKQETFTHSTQSALMKQLKIDSNLHDTDLTNLRADKVSIIAKNDVLINAYGSQILKARKNRQFFKSATHKMKELVNLLEEVKRLDPEIEDLYSALKPKHYNTLVAATKQCANTHRDKRMNYNPTYIANIGVYLRQCCNIVRKKLKPGDEMKVREVNELKTLMDRIKGNWLNDVSSQVENNVVPKKSNEITIVSLASDLKLLLDHLKRTARKALAKLKKTKHNVAAFVDLTETIFCRMLILNRISPNTLQCLPLDSYKPIGDCKSEIIGNETLSEIVLMKSLKQLISGNESIRVILPTDVLTHIDYLINIRKTYAEKGNPFLFAMPGCMTPIYGSKVMQRHAKLCKAENPKAICSKILRNHRAISSQIFNMTKNDIEQLATLMGQTYQSFNKLPNDMYETAKVTKLLILMEEGKADVYKGKSLEEIDIDLYEKLVENDTDDTKCDLTVEIEETEVEKDSEELEGNAEECRRGKRRKNIGDDPKSLNKKKRILIPWTKEQKSVVLDYFKKHIKMCKPPKRAECDHLKEIHKDLLSNKDWLKIKVFVQNAYTKK